MLTDKHDKLQYFSSGSWQLCMTRQSLWRNKPIHKQVHQNIQNPTSWSQLLHRKLMKPKWLLLRRLPLRNLISSDLHSNYNWGPGTQTIISWGLHLFFYKTREKLNPNDLVYNLDNNEYLWMSCAIRISDSKDHNLFLPHYFSLCDKNKQLNASICFMYYK